MQFREVVFKREFWIEKNVSNVSHKVLTSVSVLLIFIYR